ncbi:VTT domain-containing protein [uncultured Marinobacter sp.]|uniref:TVP38/TMEM64 family protein n=1 Tax=uncultured Marinobacter sp. TaxID=187379 RepID=UPI0030DC8BCD
MFNGFRWLAFTLLAIVGYLATRNGWLNFMADSALIANYLHNHGNEGIMAIFLAGALFTGIGAPRQILAFVLGFSLGGVNGTLVSTLATALGAAGCFFSARWLLRAPLTRRFGQPMRQFDELFRKQTFLKVFIVRLLPVGSNLATNLVAGCSGIRFLPFLAGSTLGYLPQMLVFALAGAGIGNADRSQLVLSVALFIIASVIGALLYHTQRTRNLASIVSELP